MRRRGEGGVVGVGRLRRLWRGHIGGVLSWCVRRRVRGGEISWRIVRLRWRCVLWLWYGRCLGRLRWR